MTNSGASAYLVDGVSNASISLARGSTYTFNLSVSGHPFWIKTSASTGTGNAYSTGVTNNGAQSGTLTFVVPSNAPNTLYYICQYHGGMVGTITVTDPVFDGNITGNAATATALQTARTINGVSFDGTGNITVPATGVLQLVTSAVLTSDITNVSYYNNLLQQDTIYRIVGILETTNNNYSAFDMDAAFYDTSTNTQYGLPIPGASGYQSAAYHDSICGPFTPGPVANGSTLSNAVWYDEQGSLSWWLRTDQQNNIAINGMYIIIEFSTYLGPWFNMTFGSMNNRYHTGSFTGSWSLNPMSTYINKFRYKFNGTSIKSGSKIWLYKYT